MLKRTYILAFIISGLMSLLIIFLFEVESRPFTQSQAILLYFIAFFPSMGIAMLFDPYPKMVKDRYNKINFYIQEEDPAEQVAKIIREENESKK